MQGLKNWWAIKKAQLKAFFNKKGVIFVLQLAILAAIAFCSFENGIINEIRILLESLNVRSLTNINRSLTELVISSKAMLELLQSFNFIFIIIKILVAFVLLPLVFIFFVKTLTRVSKENKQRKFSLTKKQSANYHAVYIVQSKFLC